MCSSQERINTQEERRDPENRAREGEVVPVQNSAKGKEDGYEIRK